MKRTWISISLLALVAGFAIWWFSPTQVVKRRTMSLLETLTLEPGGSPASRQMGTYALNDLLASEVELETSTIDEASGTFARAELESVFSWLCNQAKQMNFEMQRIDSVTVSGEVADVSCVLKGLVELPNYRPADGIYQAKFKWRLVDDKWRIERAVWAQVKR